jgi:hypothetical protein
MTKKTIPDILRTSAENLAPFSCGWKKNLRASSRCTIGHHGTAKHRLDGKSRRLHPVMIEPIGTEVWHHRYPAALENLPGIGQVKIQ